MDEPGLERLEESVYLLLLDRPQATLAELAGRLGCGRARVARALVGLSDGGLTTRWPGRPARWSAMAPDLAVEVLVLRRDDEPRHVDGVVDERARGDQTPRTGGVIADLVEIVNGGEAIAERWIQMLRSARVEVCGFGKEPFLAGSGDTGAELGALAKGVSCRFVYESASFERHGRLDDIDRLLSAGEEAHVVSVLPFKLAICDRRWAMLPVRSGEDDTAVVVRPSSLLDALMSIFDNYWRMGSPLPRPDEGTNHEVRAVDRRLLALLAAGLTDENIAGQLGVGVPTVQQQVHMLMELLGARSRFQAGLQAARMGWV